MKLETIEKEGKVGGVLLVVHTAVSNDFKICLGKAGGIIEFRVSHGFSA